MTKENRKKIDKEKMEKGWYLKRNDKKRGDETD